MARASYMILFRFTWNGANFSEVLPTTQKQLLHPAKDKIFGPGSIHNWPCPFLNPSGQNSGQNTRDVNFDKSLTRPTRPSKSEAPQTAIQDGMEATGQLFPINWESSSMSLSHPKPLFYIPILQLWKRNMSHPG